LPYVIEVTGCPALSGYPHILMDCERITQSVLSTGRGMLGPAGPRAGGISHIPTEGEKEAGRREVSRGVSAQILCIY
jgi:hypothetical protein